MTASAAPIELLDTLLVPSRLFGPLRVPASAPIRFPDGMLGFGGDRRFVLLPAESDGLFWLQSVEEGALAFLLADPFPLCPGYIVELAGEEPVPPPLVLCIVTLPRAAGETATINLQAPVVLDLERRSGRQLILNDPSRDTRHPFDLAARLA